jgi:hypothetical protein
MGIILLIVTFIAIAMVVSNHNFKKTIKDPKKWEGMVRDKNISFEKQDKIIKNYNLPYKPVDLSKSAVPSNTTSPVDKSTVFTDFETDLVTIWTGNTKPIEFTYEKKNGTKDRREIKPTEICFNSEGFFYIKGFCLLRNEPRTFRQDSFTTKIKVGNKRYDFDEWCEDVLNIDIWAACPNACVSAN